MVGVQGGGLAPGPVGVQEEGRGLDSDLKQES